MAGQQDKSAQQSSTHIVPSPPIEATATTDNLAKPSQTATETVYHPNPSVLKVYGQWGRLKSFNICGTSPNEHLYTVELHTGYGGSGPLGTRPGLILHNDKTTKDPVLAATGDVSQWDARAYAFSPESVILMPPIAHHNTNVTSTALVTEHMMASIKDSTVTFSFSLDVPFDEKTTHKRFHWQKIKKGVDDEVKTGGFRLVWLTCVDSVGDPASGSSDASEIHQKAVALLAWPNHTMSLTKAFTLTFTDEGLKDEFGGRWQLMVLMTALRLWGLKAHGKTTTIVVAASERAYRK